MKILSQTGGHTPTRRPPLLTFPPPFRMMEGKKTALRGEDTGGSNEGPEFRFPEP